MAEMSEEQMKDLLVEEVMRAAKSASPKKRKAAERTVRSLLRVEETNRQQPQADETPND